MAKEFYKTAAKLDKFDKSFFLRMVWRVWALLILIYASDVSAHEEI